jgi:hypothetical protein
MTKSIATLAFLSLILGPALVGFGQKVSSNINSSAEDNSHQIRNKLPEVEFVASPSFRAGSLIQNIHGPFNFEGHYFGGNENNVGYTAASWSFGREHWKLVPSLGVNFGDNGYRTMPSVGLRWEYEHEWLVSEGLLVQGLLRTSFHPEESEDLIRVAPFIADGNHVSAQWRRFMAGGTWEHIHFREGQEWKGGLRLAYRVIPSISLTMFVMGPGMEVRGGILFRPETSK